MQCYPVLNAIRNQEWSSHIGNLAFNNYDRSFTGDNFMDDSCMANVWIWKRNQKLWYKVCGT